MNTYYRRSESNWIGKSADSNPKNNYWRKQAREVFTKYPSVETVEIVYSGNKLDSAIVGRGVDNAPPEAYVIVASTGGKWGKSRRDFHPR